MLVGRAGLPAQAFTQPGQRTSPDRMRDISLFQGAAPVGSKVSFVGGVPARGGYRRYAIKSVDGMDDFAMMREVLVRRLRRGLEEEDLPDLIVVDGGKGYSMLRWLFLKTSESMGSMWLVWQKRGCCPEWGMPQTR